jgi:hypothetical protein
MAAHIEELAAELNVTIDYSYQGGKGGRACPRENRIWIRPVKSSITYAIALHELGHCAVGFISPKVGRLSEEGAAWKWAMDNSRDWTETMDRRARRSITNYVNGYRRRERRGRRVRWPEPDDFVWTLSDA